MWIEMVVVEERESHTGAYITIELKVQKGRSSG
jgi:hypothetical protein